VREQSLADETREPRDQDAGGHEGRRSAG